MLYDYSKLLGKITEVCGTQAVFALKMGLSERSVSLKLNNKIAWTQSDIQKALEVLGLQASDVQTYFFAIKVQRC